MRKRKELLAADIVRDLRFRNQTELDIYIYALEKKSEIYKVLETCEANDGTVLARIVTGYNSTPLIQLYEED